MSYKVGYFVLPEPPRTKRRVLVSEAAEANLTNEQIEALFTRYFEGDWGHWETPCLCVDYADGEDCRPRDLVFGRYETADGKRWWIHVPVDGALYPTLEEIGHDESPLRDRLVGVWTEEWTAGTSC